MTLQEKNQKLTDLLVEALSSMNQIMRQMQSVYDGLHNQAIGLVEGKPDKPDLTNAFYME